MTQISYKQFVELVSHYEDFDKKVLESLYFEFGEDVINKYFDEYFHSLSEEEVSAFIKRYLAYFDRVSSSINDIVLNTYDENDLVNMLIVNATRYPMMDANMEKEQAIILAEGKKNLNILKNSFDQLDNEVIRINKDEILYPGLNMEKILLSIVDRNSLELLNFIKKAYILLDDDNVFGDERKIVNKYLKLSQNHILSYSELISNFPELDFSNVQGLNLKEFTYQMDLLKKYVIAKSNFYHRNLRLVISLAKKNYSRGTKIEDNIQEGNIGLIKAINKYDYTKECRFSTYATWWVRQTISRSVSDSYDIIRKPIHVVDKISKYEVFCRKYIQENGVDPSIEEIASALDMKEDEVRSLSLYSSSIISLDAKLNNDEDGSGEFLDFIPSSDVPIEDQLIAKLTFEEIMDYARKVLTEKEFMVLVNRFGFNDKHISYTLEQIGSVLHVTRERVRQIESKSINKLKCLVRRNKFLER